MKREILAFRRNCRFTVISWSKLDLKTAAFTTMKKKSLHPLVGRFAHLFAAWSTRLAMLQHSVRDNQPKPQYAVDFQCKDDL